jgi:thimet oligopeptidase
MFKRLSLTAVVAAVAATVIACGAPQQAPAPPPPPTPEPVVEEAPPPPPIDPLLQRCQDRIAAAKVQREAIVAKPGLQQTLDAYNTLQIELGNAEAESSLMRAVHPEATVRDAASECEQRVAAVMTELSLDRPLYEAFAALDMTGQAADAQRLVTKTLEDFKRAGVDKDDATRARIKALNEQLVDVGQKFDKAITSDVRSIEVEPTRLKGLPQDWIDAHKPGENGKVKVTTNYPDYIPFMSYAEDDTARKELYVVYRQRAWPENGEHLKKILEIRYELATILGFPNWAAYITANKMIQNDKNAADFIARISKAAGPRSKRDLGVLLAALKTTDKAAKVVEDWQQAYLSNVVKKAKYAFDPQELRPYFHFDKVKSGLLDLTSKLFGIRYVENKDTARWHPDVSVFDVFEGEKAIGTIYLDMHPRENKYKHAAQFTLTNGVAGKQLPAGVLVCNFPNPRTGNGLMEYKDVETFFHEFGHLLHHVLGGGQRYSRFSGVATEWDFVEAPSQIFEEWASDYTTLAAFAKNDKGEAVPKALVKKLRDSEEFGKGLWVRHQMFYASLSLAMHDRDPKDLNLDQLAERQMAAHSPYPFVPDTHMQASFGHLNGYSAIYYTYMWSMVIAKDLFSAFEKAGIHDVATSMKYRKAILDPGGSKDAADLVQDFLGRKYDFKAFEKWLNR